MKEIGEYKLLEEIGSGGFSTVWRAEHPHTHKIVALKLMPLESQPGKELMLMLGRPMVEKKYLLIEMFFTEALMHGGLKHPNIPVLHDIGFDSDKKIVYLASDFVRGKTLRKILDEKHSLPVETVLNYSTQIAEALKHIHENNLIHRDLKPRNIIIDDKKNKAVLLDLGISTPSMAVINPKALTPTHASPEQIDLADNPKKQSEFGKPLLDGRSDLFSFGVVMYEMLTGKHPFKEKEKTIGELKNAVREKTPVEPAKLNPNVPEELSKIVMKLLEKNRENRYRNAGDLLKDLKKISEKISGKPEPVSEEKSVFEKPEFWREVEAKLEDLFSSSVIKSSISMSAWTKAFVERKDLKKLAERQEQVLRVYMQFLKTLSPEEWLFLTEESKNLEKKHNEILEKTGSGAKTDAEKAEAKNKQEKRLSRLYFLRKLFEASLPEESLQGLNASKRADFFWTALRPHVENMIEAEKKNILPKSTPKKVLDNSCSSLTKALENLLLCEYRGYNLISDERGLKKITPAYKIINPNETSAFKDIKFELIEKYPWLVYNNETELKKLAKAQKQTIKIFEKEYSKAYNAYSKASNAEKLETLMKIVKQKAVAKEQLEASNETLKLMERLREHPGYIVTTTPIEESFEEVTQNPYEGNIHGKLRLVYLPESVGTTDFQETLSGLSQKGPVYAAIKVRAVSESTQDAWMSFKAIHSKEKDWTALLQPSKAHTVHSGSIIQKLYAARSDGRNKIGVAFYIGKPNDSLLKENARRMHGEALERLSKKTFGEDHGEVIKNIPVPKEGFLVAPLIALILADKIYSIVKKASPKSNFIQAMNGQVVA